MPRFTLLLAALVVVFLAGCDSKPSTPGTDPESIKRLEQLQKEGAQGEPGKQSNKKE
jgi:entry exclusion lipoprotein TrbK